jgi:hypothetical protein
MPCAPTSDWLVETKFLIIQKLVASRVPRLQSTRINLRCQKIARLRRTSERAYMHVGCKPRTICTWAPAANLLPESILFGILLHEFGHLAGNDEGGADRWVYRTLGIPIRYATRLRLESVSPTVIRTRLERLNS